MKINNLKLPDFMIVGAAKSGTTSLYYYLKQHPYIYMPKRKEPWFFSSKNYSKRTGVVNTLEEYAKLFENAKEYQLIGEASVSYLCTYEETIKNIKEIYKEKTKDIKIIIVLRNPIERIFSRYMMFKRDNWINNESFLENVLNENKYKERFYWDENYIECSMYYNQVKAYLENFENVLCLPYEDLRDNLDDTIKQIFSFLNLKHININTETKFNVSGIPKNKIIHNIMHTDNLFKDFVKNLLPADFRVKVKEFINSKNLKKDRISKEDYEYLYNNFFKEDIDKLEKLLGWNLENWKSYEKYYKK